MSELELIPKQLVSRFRSVALERLERIEAAWLALTQRTAGPQTEAELFQDIHTLKGDARVVGFADVGLLSQRLEDLLFAARRRRFRVHEDVDVVVTMAVQFLRMLLRKRAGTSQGGIDLGGFLKHVDEVLAEWPRTTEAPAVNGTVSAPRTSETLRIPPAVRLRLATVATNVFVEYLATARGSRSRARLRSAWDELAKQLAELDAVALDPLLRRHSIASSDLAMELGKEVDVTIDAADATVGVEVLDALNAALVHALRNAVDHGIETPDERKAKGKPRRGAIRLRVTSDDHAIELVVTDDGAGVDFAKARTSAVVGGHLSPTDASSASETDLLRLLFVPGFSLRDAITPISGRGVGMDAVSSAVRGARGSVDITSAPGNGVTMTVRLPQARRTLDVHRLPSSSPEITLAVPSSWSVREDPELTTAVDPLTALGIPTCEEGRRIVVLQRDHEAHAIYVGGPATPATAIRICPSPAGEVVEVVQLDEQQALLLRPETFFTQASLGDQRRPA